MGKLSKVFIGSSSEGKDVAERLADLLDDSGLTESTVWTENVFRPGRHVLGALIEQAKSVDYAVMVLSPDDDVVSRAATTQAPRDNVILELGLFLGALGAERTYMVLPRGTDLKLPTDVDGITYLPYRTRGDNNMSAALRSVVIKILDEVRLAGPRDGSPSMHPLLSASTTAERNIDNDIRMLISNLTPQGWTFKRNEMQTRLTAKSPRGTKHTLKMGPPANQHPGFDQFLRELRGYGARFDSSLREHKAG